MKKYFLCTVCALLALTPRLSFGSESVCIQVLEKEIPGFKKNDLNSLSKGYRYEKYLPNDYQHEETGIENMLQSHRDDVPDYDRERYSPSYLAEPQKNPVKVKVANVWTKKSGTKVNNPLFKFYYSDKGNLVGILANTGGKLDPKDKKSSSKFYQFTDDDNCNLTNVNWIDNKFWDKSDKIIYFSATKEKCDDFFKNYETEKQKPLKTNDIRLIIPFKLACQDAGGTRENFSCMCPSGFPTNPGPYFSTCNPPQGRRGNSGPEFVTKECRQYSNMWAPKAIPMSKESNSKNKTSTPTETAPTAK